MTKKYSIKDRLRCPHINFEKAKAANMPYYCDLDDSSFYSMPAHCNLCSIYDKLCKRAYRLIVERGILYG